MTSDSNNRFEDFFANETYVQFKNDLYNYRLRKRAVEKAMRYETKGIVLEIGSGISPVLTSWDQTVYSDLSPAALNYLEKTLGKGRYVLADAENLPFDDESFSHVIASEVLEHLKDDGRALSEMARVLKPDGALIITFPHRKFYFAFDDRFVGHYRRYEISEMAALLKQNGFDLVYIKKVLGPLEKMTMCAVTYCASVLERHKKREGLRRILQHPPAAVLGLFKWLNRLYAGLVWLDARILPQALSTVLLIKANKKVSI